MKRTGFVVLVLGAVLTGYGADECAPETWFHVIGGNASKEGIVADLDAIRAAGIRGIQFFHGSGDLWPGVTNPIPCLSAQWEDLVRFTSEECHRRGLTFKMQNCPGWSMSGGPWVPPEKAMRKLVCWEKGSKRALTGADVQLIGEVTFPVAVGESVGDLRPSETNRPSKGERIYRFDTSVTVRSLTMPSPSRLNAQHCCEPMLSFELFVDGKSAWKHVCPDGNWYEVWAAESVMTFDVGELTGREWRFVITKEGPWDFAFGRDIVLSAARRMDQWRAKAGRDLRGLDLSTDARPIAVEGEKTLVFAHVNAGKRNHPAPPEGTGWECDKMDPAGFETNWRGYLGKLAAAGVKIDGTLVDSWECGAQTWTWKMEEEFRRRKGYELKPFLPALFGYIIKSPAATERFLLDWRDTCSRLVEENYYGTIARLAHENGMSVQYETAFGDVIQGDLLRFWKYADEPMCEFWSPHNDAAGFVGSHNFKPVLPCVSAAHVYGKRRVSAESLTSFNLTFDENFVLWKDIIDRHFGRGVTHIVFHTYTHNPVIGGKPPSTSFGANIGSPFLRLQTWWPYMPDFTGYLTRCGRALERGKPWVDILWYLGDALGHKPSERELLFGDRYKYDYCNQDVLLGRLDVKDGRFVLPDGMSYRVLWIPLGTFLLPESEQRIAALAAKGGRVIRGDFTPDWPSPLKKLGGRKPDFWYARRDGDEEIFFTAEQKGASRLITFKDGVRSEIDPVTGLKPEPEPTAEAVRAPLAFVPAETYPVWATNRIYTATYDFIADGEKGPVLLSLGTVRDWATVSVNGKVVRRLWCNPYRCDIAPFLKPGANEIRIEVTSTWYNRLVHDAGLPEAERLTWTLKGPGAKARFAPAGLLGPATIVTPGDDF